jgi:hypothetical protein
MKPKVSTQPSDCIESVKAALLRMERLESDLIKAAERRMEKSGG